MVCACSCLSCTGTSPWFISSQLTTAGNTWKGAHINRRSCLFELHQKCYFALVLIKQCCTYTFTLNQVSTLCMSKEYQQLQVVLNEIFGEKTINNSSSESAIRLIDKNIVFEKKQSNIQSEFIITRSEIQAVPLRTRTKISFFHSVEFKFNSNFLTKTS